MSSRAALLTLSFVAVAAVIATRFAPTPLSAARSTHAANATHASPSDFVRVRDGQFVIGDRPYHFVGVNFWFAMPLGAEQGDDRPRLVRELDRLQRLGITNLRIMASSEGPATEPFRVQPALQERPGVFNEHLLGGLDFLLAEMARRDMRGVLVLNNFFQWTGGMAQYVSWATGTPIPYPEVNGHSWDDFQNYASKFYASDSTQRLFEHFVQAIVARQNTVTHVAYRDDPTIMAWQLSNEPRGFENADAYVKWVDRAGAFLHKVAPNQLVSLGGEGKLAQDLVNTRFDAVSRSPALDYLTLHLWIENWGWYDPKAPSQTFDRAVGRSIGYIADHVAIARDVRKPLVIEEFGVSRDGGAFAASAPVSYRDRFLTMILESVHHLAAEGEPVAGANVWSWSGESRPVRAGESWRGGEPFTGDPPHEKQGWYSIYDADTSTIGIIARYARMLDTVRLRAWAVRAAADSVTVRVNQVGFLPRQAKVAIVPATDAMRYVVIREGPGDTAFTGTLSALEFWQPSGESVRRADFSALTRPGRYYLRVSSGERSPSFNVRNDAWREVARAAVKAFYFQRASVDLPATYAGPWARPAGHPDTKVLVHPSAASLQRPAGTVLSAPGGWYDAGDYNKYIVNSGISTYEMLLVSEHYPQFATALRTNIPESANALPDALDEALVNLRWMLTMQDPADGGVYHKLTTAKFDSFEMPADDHLTRYVVAKSTAATLDFAAVMAHASVSLRAYERQLPGLADSCARAALSAWQWAKRNPNVLYSQNVLNAKFSPPIVTGEYGDGDVRDERRWAAAELLIATRDTSFLMDALPVEAEPAGIPDWSSVGTLGLYSLLDHRREFPKRVDTLALRRRLLDLADTLVARARVSPYRVPMGAPTDWVWGSNAVAANQGVLLLQAYRVTGRADYRDAAVATLDYLLGRNPTGYAFVTGFGFKSPHHPHHRMSFADGIDPPVPGLLVGGPNPGRQDGCSGYPSVLPALAYLDETCSYASNEIAINWNAPFAYLAVGLSAEPARTTADQQQPRSIPRR